MDDDLSSQHARDQLTARIDDLAGKLEPLHSDYRDLLEHVNEMIDRLDDAELARLRIARLAARTMCQSLLMMGEFLFHVHGEPQPAPAGADVPTQQAHAAARSAYDADQAFLNRILTEYHRTEVKIQTSAKPVEDALTLINLVDDLFQERRPGHHLMRKWDADQIEAYGEQQEP